MKGAAGQAVQCMNVMLGMEERTGLNYPPLRPV
jgi:N-acetyl-gamma-glutamylphosphate reductase